MKKTTFEKYMTREHSLFFFVMWNLDAVERTKNWVGYNLKHVLFRSEGPAQKVSVWHNKEELDKYYSDCKSKLLNDEDYFRRTKAEYLSFWEKLLPYFSGEKKPSCISELKGYFENLLSWWGPMANLFMVQEFEGVPKSVIDEALRLRELTERFSDKEDEVFLNFMKEYFPEYSELVMFLLPEEVFQLENRPLSEEQLLEVKKRMGGYFLWHDTLRPLSELGGFLSDKGFVLKTHGSGSVSELRGSPAFKGVVNGMARVVLRKDEFDSFLPGEVLVTDMTSPEFVPLIKKASAIVTDEGGIMCHAAIVSRELKVPCVTGTKVATQVLQSGDLVEVNADEGVVKILKRFVGE